MKISKKLIATILTLALIITFVPTSVKAATKEMTTGLEIQVGKSQKLYLSNATGTVTWATSDKKIVTVSSTGKIKAVKVGTATVTATVNKTKYKYEIKVVPKPTLNKTKVTVTVGKTYTLKLNNAIESIKWASSDETIATVSKKGVVTAVNAGTATITATSDNLKYTCKVTVEPIDVTKLKSGQKTGETITNNNGDVIKVIHHEKGDEFCAVDDGLEKDASYRLVSSKDRTFEYICKGKYSGKYQKGIGYIDKDGKLTVMQKNGSFKADGSTVTGLCTPYEVSVAVSDGSLREIYGDEIPGGFY